MLDEFVALTGYHRKRAIRVLVGEANANAASERSRPRGHDELLGKSSSSRGSRPIESAASD